MEGSFFTYKHHNGKLAAVVGLSCQTDFAARTTLFKTVGEDLVMHVASSEAEDLESLMKEPLLTNESKTLGTYLQESEVILGEALSITHLQRFVF